MVLEMGLVDHAFGLPSTLTLQRRKSTFGYEFDDKLQVLR